MPYLQINRDQIEAQLQTDWESVPFWGLTEGGDVFNQVLRLWNLLTGTWKRKQIIPTVAAQVFYAIPGTFTFGFRVAWNGKPLLPSSLDDLGGGRPQWRKETTASGGTVPTEPQVWAPSGLTSFAIWPADAAANNALELDGIAATPVLTGGHSNLDIDQAEFGPLKGEALHILTYKLGGDVFEATKGKHTAFLMAAADKNSRLKASSYFRKLLGLDRARGTKTIRETLDERFGRSSAGQG